MKIACVIIALDFSKPTQAYKFIDKFSRPVWFKVGMELAYASNFKVIKYLKSRNHKVFLDLKLFDIPSVVGKTIAILEKYQVDFITIHLLGGFKMLEAAQLATKKTKLFGVSVLTSIDEKSLNLEMGINQSLTKQVELLAQQAIKANLYGVVCSVNEAKMLKPLKLKIISPGIRRKNDLHNDQKRVFTPSLAKEMQVDYIVVGRPIAQAKNPVTSYQQFVKEFHGEGYG